MPPLGGVVSGVTVKFAVAGSPAPFVAVTVFPAFYRRIAEAFPEAWLEESLPKTVGKSTCAMPDCASAAVAVTVNDAAFEPVGL